MRPQALNQAIEASADPARAAEVAGQLRETSASGFLKKLKPEQARILAAVLGGSAALGELLVAHPDWLPPLLEPGTLEFARHEQGVRRELEQTLKPLLQRNDHPAALAALREFKQREMLRIGTRDLARLADALEITSEISRVADLCLDVVCRVCRRNLVERVGKPYFQDADGDWHESLFCVLGMGKLGGQELNYSSDVDLLFVYSEEGHVFKNPPRRGEEAGKGLTNHQFFTRLAEQIIAEVSKMTPEGSLFRIDMRLRPEGKTGPLARSLDSYENYYAQWGQTWERMMLIKARPAAGDVSLGAEFLEMIQPFRYPRSLNRRTLGEVAAVKKRIEKEIVKEGQMERNVKLGRGGIREIEFVVQTMQILHAGHSPFLQGASTIPVLRKLVEYSLIPAADAKQLEEAYLFLRDVEHRLQMEANQQTHTIPTERRARERLARLMDFEDLRGFEAARSSHADAVRRIYDKTLAGDEPEPAARLPDDDTEEAGHEWEKFLARHGFCEPEQAWQMASTFLHGPGYVHVSQRTVELARELLPRFLALCLPPKPDQPPTLSDPDRVLVRLDSFVDSYGARATLYEVWTQNPPLFQLLLLLFDRSEFLAEKAIRSPDLVYELEVSGRLQRQKTSAETLKELRHGLNDTDQHLWLRKYHQAEWMRIGLRSILGVADVEQIRAELSALADACLQYALEGVTRRARLKTAPFCVVGLGKLGGKEIDYGSDLDLVFVTSAEAGKLPALQRLAVDFLDLLGRKTELGAVFPVDARLRPDGEKGLLVNNLEAFEEYYRKRAGLWEIQALTRIRPIAGDMETGAKFQQLAATLTDFRARPARLAAFTPAWKKDVHAMRERIVRERTPAGKEDLAIKTGKGGLMDAEFLAQSFCLGNGWQEANTLAALKRGAEAGLLKPEQASVLLENYQELRRIELILRRWSYEGEVLLPDDAPARRRVAIRCGYASAASFLAAVGKIRAAIHSVYAKYFA